MGATGKNLTFLDISESLSWAADAEIITALEGDFVRGFLAKARWVPRDRESGINPRIIARLPFSDDSTFFVVIDTEPRERYLLILRAAWSTAAIAKSDKSVVARLRLGEREGVLLDVAADPVFVRQLLIHLRRDASIAGSGWRLDFRPTTKLGHQSPDAPSRVRAIEGE